jgi:hypothetical protein
MKRPARPCASQVELLSACKDELDDAAGMQPRVTALSEAVAVVS